mmetsp:Transcript_11164/g.24562  ORF Transcript_11164/g.24562 Transcript_11164/m.24562 type:complete len:216 (+) Transcript_11164:373-1020(+)
MPTTPSFGGEPPSERMLTMSPTPPEGGVTYMATPILPDEPAMPTAPISSSPSRPKQQPPGMPTGSGGEPVPITPSPIPLDSKSSKLPTASPEQLRTTVGENDNTGNDELSPTISPESLPTSMNNGNGLPNSETSTIMTTSQPSSKSSKSSSSPSSLTMQSETIAIVRAREHASTRWEREHPNGDGDGDEEGTYSRCFGADSRSWWFYSLGEGASQ